MNEMSPQLLILLVDVSWRIAALAGAVALLIKLGRLTDPALLHVAWRGVLLGMLALPALCLWVPALPVSPPTALTAVPAALEALAAAPESLRLGPPAVAPRPSVAQVAPPTDEPMPAVEVAGISNGLGAWQWPSLLVLIYGLGVAVMAARLAGAWWLTRRLIADGQPLPGQDLSHDFEHRRTRFALHSTVRGPLSTGWLRPTVLLPWAWHSWDTATRRYVITHELMHIRRGDYAVQLLAAVNRCVFWFHPLAWMLPRQLATLAEKACDQGVVERCGDGPRYARVLLEVAAAVATEPSRPAWIGAAMLDGGNLSPRVEAVLAGPRKWQKLRRLAAWSLAGLIAAGVAGAASLRVGPVAEPLPVAIRGDLSAPQPKDTARAVAHPTRGTTAMALDRANALSPQPTVAAISSIETEPFFESQSPRRPSVAPLDIFSSGLSTGGPSQRPVARFETSSRPGATPVSLIPSTPETALAGSAAPGSIQTGSDNDGPEVVAGSTAGHCDLEHNYILWFDDQGRKVSRGQPLSASPKRWLKDVAQWIREDLCPTDRVAIVSFKGRMRIHLDFTLDRETAASALAEVTRLKPSPVTSIPAAEEPSLVRALPPPRELKRRSRELDRALQLLAEAAATVEGRKDLIILTRGFSNWNNGSVRSSIGSATGRTIFKSQTEQIRNSGVVVHAIRTGSDSFYKWGGVTTLTSGTGGLIYTGDRGRRPQARNLSILKGLRAIARAIELGLAPPRST